MWSDNETDLDLLNVAYLVSAVTETVLNTSLLPITVGVFGDWGSGKSSILRMIQKELGNRENVLCLSFNGWLFEGYEDAKAALMGTILDEIRANRTLGAKAKELITRLAKRIDYFALMGMIGKHAATFMIGDPSLMMAQIGTDIGKIASKVVEKVPELIKKDDTEDLEKKEALRKNIREFRDDFKDLLRETKIETLAVFIDDLDRCLPNTVIETLEAMRLFLFVEGTAFIIGADERMVEQAVERRFPDPFGARSELSRNYLEKLVQVPVRIPPLGPNEVRSYMNLLFAQLRFGDGFEKLRQKISIERQGGSWDFVLDYGWFQENAGELPAGLTEDLDLTERIGNILAEMLSGNPRQVKRFLNTLVLRMQMSQKRGVKLKQGILAKLMVLEYKKPESFRLIAGLQGEQNGKPMEFEILEGKALKQKAEDSAEIDEERTSGDGRSQKSETRKTKQKPRSLSTELTAWLDDLWLSDWLRIEPSLVGVDLRSYFYVSRDRIGPIAGPRLQLSPTAQGIFEKLISESDAERMNGTESAGTLSDTDASAVLQALVGRALRTEKYTGDDAPVNVLIEYAAVRPELIGESVRALGRIPAVRLGPEAPPRLAALKEISPAFAKMIDDQLAKWTDSKVNSVLATAAAYILGRQ